MKKTNKILAIALAVVTLALAVTVGTFAWLTSVTDEVKNTVTVGKVEITLAETVDANFDGVVPGDKLAKDPKVTVKADSVACYLFVTVENTTKGIDYAIADGWTELASASTDGKKVYSREVEKNAADQSFQVLAGDVDHADGVISVADDVVAGADFTGGEITFKAYAIQKSNVESLEAAWNAVKDL